MAARLSPVPIGFGGFSGEASSLLCPRCGFSYLHHRKVHVFSRREDAATGTELAVRVADDFGGESGGVQVLPSSPLAGNPSSRRGGVVIAFECEGCGEISELCFAQHKGETAVCWREPRAVATQ